MPRGCMNWNFVAAQPDRIFASREAASGALADHIANTLKSAITETGHASLVVSGGTSPLETFHALRRKSLPWTNVTIVPSDERLVAVDHEDSNEGMIRRELLQEEAATASLMSLAGDDVADNERFENLNTQLSMLHKPLDMVMLGIGDDGHTASLFPNSPDVREALNCDDYCVVQNPPHLDVARMSLTPACLLDASEIVLLFFGYHKRSVYERACRGGAVEEFPIRFVLNQKRVPVTVYWAA